MEELGKRELAFGSVLPPAVVSLTPFNSIASPSPRRLSSCYTHPSEPVRAKRQLAWVSLHDRLVGAEEATAVKTVDRNGGFSAEEEAAWELFTPIQRVLVVAVVSAAIIDSKKNQLIFKLQKSVEITDQVLQSMQQKMDKLLHQVKYFSDLTKAATTVDVSVTRRTNCGCEPCHHHSLPSNHALGSTSTVGSNEDDVFEYKTPVSNVIEAEERRMSDLSDWAPSAASSVDNQFKAGATTDNITSLKENGRHNDGSMVILFSLFRKMADTTNCSCLPVFCCACQRIAYLEDVIRRKNTLINKLRKDIRILEQKVMNLTRVRRPSFLASSLDVTPLPFMANNALYDMDNTPSPSSDSDSSPRIQTPVQLSTKALTGSSKRGQLKSSTGRDLQQKHLKTSPLKESSINLTPNSVPASAMKPRHFPGAENRSRRRLPARSREVTAPKRWI